MIWSSLTSHPPSIPLYCLKNSQRYYFTPLLTILPILPNKLKKKKKKVTQLEKTFDNEKGV